jgi:hypothetical protein
MESEHLHGRTKEKIAPAISSHQQVQNRSRQRSSDNEVPERKKDAKSTKQKPTSRRSINRQENDGCDHIL